MKLVATGNNVIKTEEAEPVRTMQENTGSLGGVYEPGELERPRQAWPACSSPTPAF